MRIGTMFSDILQSFFKRPATQKYPFIRKDAPKRYRGKLVWHPEKCTGCGLCAKDCPSFALDMIVLDRAKKQYVVRYQVDRCTFCGQCVQNCRFKCMELSSGLWELAALNRNPFTVYYGDEANIQTVQHGQIATEPAPSSS